VPISHDLTLICIRIHSPTFNRNRDDADIIMLAEKQTALTIADLAPQIGSEIESDVPTLLSGVHAARIRALLEDRGVVIFRELNLTDQQQVAFTKTLGTIVEEGENNIYKVSLDPMENVSAEYLKGAFFWHIDGTLQNVPVLASLLSCWRPSPTGGQTEFCNTYAAYDDLPEADKKTLDTLQVVHSQEAAQRYVNPEPTYAELQAWRNRVAPRTLPLVWKHRSGRKSLVLGSTAAHVVGLKAEDSAELLCRLRDHATQPQYKYCHEWKVGDLVIWDNTGTMHRALAYPLDCGRMMHRTKLQGEEPFQ
jgi:alpha-ketoglutarate-dependent taurine dioxygenase